jgi:lipid-A-disaccharide synthase
MLRIGIVAGEASGDLMAAQLIKAITRACPLVVFEGIAGPNMIAEGCRPIFKTEQLSVMGVVEVLQRLPQILLMRRAIKNYFRQNLPAVFIGMDAPDFNLSIEAFLRTCGVPTIHYNSPTIWAWRKRRVHAIGKAVSLMLTLFPFENAIYEQHKIPAQFIGHPLADSIPEIINVKQVRSKLGIDVHAKVIALLPGSRAGEINQLGTLFLDTALLCLHQDSALKFVVPFVNEARRLQFQELCSTLPKNFPIQLFTANSQEVIAASDAVLVASGTATLETALLQKPMVVAYRVNWLNYQIARLLIDVPYFSLPNLLLNKAVVPEFFQQQATADRLSEALMNQLHLPENTPLFADFKQIRKMLAQSASERAANVVLGLVEPRNVNSPMLY